MESTTLEVTSTPKVVLDYKNNAINAVVSAVIGVTITGIAAFMQHKFEQRAAKKAEVK